MNVSKFDKATCKAFSEDLIKVLEKFAADRGLTVQYGGGRFDVSGADFTPKVTFKTAAADRALWDQYCAGINLLPEHYGKPISSGRGVLTICGINPRNGKVIASAPDGKKYLLAGEAARRHFNRAYDWEKK